MLPHRNTRGALNPGACACDPEGCEDDQTVSLVIHNINILQTILISPVSSNVRFVVNTSKTVHFHRIFPWYESGESGSYVIALD